MRLNVILSFDWLECAKSANTASVVLGAIELTQETAVCVSGSLQYSPSILLLSVIIFSVFVLFFFLN